MLKSDNLTVADAIEHYLTHTAPNRLKPSTLKTATVTLKKWRKSLGTIPLAQLGTSDILDYRDTIANVSTANRYVSVLSSCLRSAVEREMIPYNPCANIQPLRVPRKETGKVIPHEHQDTIMRHAMAHNGYPMGYYTLLALLFNTGCRLSEALRLAPEHITHGDKPTLIFYDTKSNIDRVIPIPQWLDSFLQSHPLPDSAYRTCWKKTLKHIGTKYRYHDIRHTVITRLIEQGYSPIAVGQYVGHNSIAITQRYTHPNTEVLRNNLDIQ